MARHTCARTPVLYPLLLSKLSLLALAITLVQAATASETLTAEPDGSSYHFVSHYSIDVAAPAKEVWKHLVALDSWMSELDLTLESGNPGQEGEVRRLYSGQDFFIEITKVVPDELLVFANLPSRFNGESSTGVVVITLNESSGTTTVKLTMSRRYSWDSGEANPQRSMRESPAFRERTRAMWTERFLPKLKSLAES